MRAIQFGAKHFVVNSTSLQLLNDFVLGFETEKSEVRQSFLANYPLCPLSHFTKLVPLYQTNPGNALRPKFLRAIFLGYHRIYSEC